MKTIRYGLHILGHFMSNEKANLFIDYMTEIAKYVPKGLK
jgi:hypothetical protein